MVSVSVFQHTDLCQYMDKYPGGLHPDNVKVTFLFITYIAFTKIISGFNVCVLMGRGRILYPQGQIVIVESTLHRPSDGVKMMMHRIDPTHEYMYYRWRL